MSAPESHSPKLLDRLSTEIQLRHYSPRTREAYVAWARRFIMFHGKRHPRELGFREVSSFLSSLAARGAAASTQNQALSAILFLYKVVLGQRVPWMHELVPAQRPVRLPVVLSRVEVSALLAESRWRRRADGVLDLRMDDSKDRCQLLFTGVIFFS